MLFFGVFFASKGSKIFRTYFPFQTNKKNLCQPCKDGSSLLTYKRKICLIDEAELHNFTRLVQSHLYGVILEAKKLHKYSTLKCLSIGTPKIITFPFVSSGKLMVFRCPNIQACCNEAVFCLNFGTPENNEFSIWDKWKIYYFRCPNT